MMFKPVTNQWKQRAFVFVGGLFLIGIILSGWIPQPCPYLRQAISACPRSLIVKETPEQQELNRIAHRTIDTENGIFSTAAQVKRRKTDVNFWYRTDYSQQVAYLQIYQGNKYQTLALVTHPLLVSLDWQRIISKEPTITLFQRQETFGSLSEFQAKLPPAKTLAADPIAAAQFGLTSEQYTDFTNLTSLDNFNFVLTSYSPPDQDGTWRQFDHIFNLENYQPKDDNTFGWEIFVPQSSGNQIPFLIGEVHIDYQDDRFGVK